MLDLEQVLGRSLDVLRDLMPVSGAKQECAQDQHVQSSLQQFNAVGGFFRHSASRYSTQISCLLGRRATQLFVRKGLANPGEHRWVYRRAVGRPLPRSTLKA